MEDLMTDNKPRKRWITLEIRVVDVEGDNIPSAGMSSYNQRDLTSTKLSVPVGTDVAGLLVAIDELGQAVRNTVSQAQRIVPLEKPEPESDQEPAKEAEVVDIPF